VGISSASCSANSSAVLSVTLETMARTAPADREPSRAAAAVTGRDRRRRALRTTRVASPPAMVANSRSQAVMEVAASVSHSSNASNSP
jgi:hypothetical protein